MHSRLLHGALQKEETRVIVVEIEVELKKPREDEESYAADFEILGQEDKDESDPRMRHRLWMARTGNMTRSRRRTSIRVRTGLACVSS